MKQESFVQRLRVRSFFKDAHLVTGCALLALVLALAAPFIDPEAWSRQRTSFLAKEAISQLLREAQLPTRVPDPAQRLPLALQTMDESQAEVAGLKEAMAKHPGISERVDSRHRLLANVHRWGSVFAVELRLLRRGWALRMEGLERFIHAPWVPSFALLLASVLCFRPASRWLFMPVAAGVAQASLGFLRRGQAYREIPVSWKEWPDGVYARVDEAWLRVVFLRPEVSIAIAVSLLGLGIWLSHRAKARSIQRSSRELCILGLWLAGSLVWWDATFRSSLPLGELWVGGAGWMRLSRTASSVAWGISAVMILRRPAPDPLESSP